ncbi:uncharacterized protein N7498_000137, partial [Penicillium cinerascens]
QKATPRWVSIYWLSAVVFCLFAAGSILDIPLTQLIEDNICSRYAQQGTTTDRHCKTDDIQFKLAYLNGNLPLVEAVVGIDRPAIDICMKISELTHCSRAIFEFHYSIEDGSFTYLGLGVRCCCVYKVVRVQAILAGTLFTVVVGGNTLLLANLYSIASDLVAQSDRASAFFLVAFSSLVGASPGPGLQAAFAISQSRRQGSNIRACIGCMCRCRGTLHGGAIDRDGNGRAGSA